MGDELPSDLVVLDAFVLGVVLVVEVGDQVGEGASSGGRYSYCGSSSSCLEWCEERGCWTTASSSSRLSSSEKESSWWACSSL
jgi:hypothetical protein